MTQPAILYDKLRALETTYGERYFEALRSLTVYYRGLREDQSYREIHTGLNALLTTLKKAGKIQSYEVDHVKAKLADLEATI